MYRIIWMPWAFTKMNEIVRSNPQLKAALTKALQELSVDLRTKPNDTGESRDSPVRVGFFKPITVTFRVSETQRTTYITDVHLPQ